MSDEERRDTPPQPTNPNATRDHLANERTLLAWVRTGVAIAGLGVVVARFGLLIRELGPNAPRHTPPGLSTGFGVILVACSAALVILATLRYRGTATAIDTNTYRWSFGLILTLCSGFVVVAVLLVVYLLLTE